MRKLVCVVLSLQINFTTSDTSVYENLLAYLEELGVEPATIADITDQAYLNDVEY